MLASLVECRDLARALRLALLCAACFAVMSCPEVPIQALTTLEPHTNARLQQSTAEASSVDAERIEKLFDMARSGRSIVRPQAAAKLAEYGAPAAERIKREAGATNAELAQLGKDLVGVLGAFGDDELRARAWSALLDPDFAWRPAASRTLAQSAQPAELERFVALCDDPLAAVRENALVAFGTLDARDQHALVRAALADPSDRVRSAAIACLAAWGEPEVLSYYAMELRRTDSFFDLDTGGIARFQAATALDEWFGDEHGYRPDQPHDSEPNQLAYALITADLLAARGERPAVRFPAISEPHDPIDESTGPALLGLELRSCRRGEYFLRWTANDRLVVGTGNAVVVELAPGTAARLTELADARLAELGDERFWGQPGCDSELYHRRPLGADRTQVLELSKGPEAADELRPEPLDALALALLATLPDAQHADPRLDRLATRARGALEALGGALDSE